MTTRARARDYFISPDSTTTTPRPFSPLLAPLVNCWRVYSHSIIEPLTWTFNDRMIPCCGISTQRSTSESNVSGMPSFSRPRSKTTRFGKRNCSNDVLPVVCSSPTMVQPLSRIVARYPGSDLSDTASSGIHFSAVTLIFENNLSLVARKFGRTNLRAWKISHVRARPARFGNLSISDATTMISCRDRRDRR